MSFSHQIAMNKVMMPEDANPSGNVHGGEIMKLMDTAAAVSAIKYAKNPCVTFRADEMIFEKPVKVGSLVNCTASIIYTGKTSIEVFVEVTSEPLDRIGGPEKCISAFFTMIAVNKKGRPKKVKEFIPETEDEIKLNKRVKERRTLTKSRI